VVTTCAIVAAPGTQGVAVGEDRIAMKLASGAVIAGKYRLEKRLAIGGMGELWTGQHIQLDVHVAIKFMDPNHAGSALARQRFEREAKMVASLKSAHVVHVQDYGVEDDRPYIVMELLQGEDMSKRLKRERRLSLAVTSTILMQIARGLRRAHEAGLIHRDLKPPNIFMARGEDEEEVVKILDFGIAKDTMEPALGEGTKTGELMGSPHFMSPEQIRGSKDIDHRSDLWSLGVILFRTVTGSLPFKGEAIGAVIAQILADPIPVPSALNPSLSPAVDAYFMRAFSRDRETRFQSAREMAEVFAALARAEANPGAVILEGISPSGYPAAADAALLGATPNPFTPNPFTPRPSSAPEGAESNEPKTTPAVQRVMPSNAPADLFAPPDPARASQASLSGAPPSFGPSPSSAPRPAMYSATGENAGAPESASTFNPTPSGGGLMATGGPLIQSAIPPPLTPSRGGAVWLGVGAVSVVLVGAAIAFLMRGAPTHDPVATAAPIAGQSDPAPSSSVALPAPSASAEATPSAAPSDSAAPSADSSAAALAKSASPIGKAPGPLKAGPLPSASAKKKPTWGF